LYFVEVRSGYRCGWFYQDGSRLVMQPNPLSLCLPEAWRMPEEAEVVGRVTGMVTPLNGPGSISPGESPAEHGDSAGLAPIPRLDGLSDLVSGLSVRMETAMKKLGERAALAAELALSFDGRSTDIA
jgi:hypothetical protein